MKKNLFLAVAAMAMALTSCNKEEGTGGNGVVPEGKGTHVSLSLKMPAASLGSRAIDEGPLTATSGESAVKTVDVFIFESNGGPAQVGAYTRLAVSDFDENTPGTYQLKADKVIKTLTGAKRIYVGVNVPLASFSGNEAALLAAMDDVLTMSTETTGFTMFSDVEPVDLTTEDNPTTPEIEANTVAFQVRRVVSKVATSTSQDTYTKNWTDTEAPLELVYNINDFRVFQQTLDSYVAPNYWSVGGIAKTLPGIATTPVNTTDDVFSDFADDADATAAAIGLHPTSDANIVAMEGFYIGENYPVENSLPMALNGNSTYVMISTTATADMYATWVDNNTDLNDDQASNPTDGYVKWEAMPTGTTYGGGVVGSHIYVVQANGKHFVTNTRANADAVALGNGLTPDSSDATDDGIYTYKDGYVHFQVYLNREDINNYAILRNQFVHVKINDILAQNFLFPGYPGDPDDPSKPTDPTKEDPENPDPIDPTDPVDGAPAYLQVEVVPLPWTYKENNTILQ